MNDKIPNDRSKCKAFTNSKEINIQVIRNLRVRWLILLTLSFSSLPSFSQEDSKGEVYKYAHSIIDTLAAPGMHGRGYVNGGDSIAAKYIADRFVEFGLNSFEKIDDKHPKGNYYQRFGFPINIIDTVRFAYAGGKRLTLGRDFLVSPSSPSAFGLPAKISWLDSNTYANKKKLARYIKKQARKNRYLAIDFKISERDVNNSTFQHVRGFIFIKHEKLTNDLSQTVDRLPSIQLLASNYKNLKKELKKYPVNVEFHSKLDPDHKTQNLIGYIKGTQYPDSFIVCTAHYDHLGGVMDNFDHKEVYFPGANDNASGCAMLLSLAKYYSQHPQKYSIAFMAFAGEEAGLLGSQYYIGHPLFPLKQIKFLVNFDMVGTGEEGIKVVNATEFPTQFKTLQVLNAQSSYLTDVSPRGKAANSDHYFFYQNGVKCFFIYTLGGIKAYHDIYDRSETLPLTKFEELYKLILDFNDWLQNNK